MITFYDLFPNIKSQLYVDKQKEMLKKVKKPYLCTMKERGRDALDILSTTSDNEIKTYLDGAGEPIRGYADGQSVIITAMYKRFLPLLAKSLSEQNWFQRIITLLALKYNLKIWSYWFEYVFFLNQCLLKDDYWCQPVKELRRVLKGTMDENLIDAISLLFEYDSSYRYPLQDILSELDKNNGTIKEFLRLMDILIKRYDIRESNKGQVDKFNKIKKFIKLLLVLNPKIKILLRDIFNNININEMKLSKEDIYWTNLLEVYNYRGLSIEQRRNENLIKYGKNII